MEQVGVFDRIGDVVALGVAVLLEVVGDLDVDGALGIGEALELEPEVLARDAAGAFGADEIGAGNRFGLARRIGHLRDHAVGALREAGERRRQVQLDIGMRLRQRERFLHDLDALALQHVGKRRVVLEAGVIELGDQLALPAIPVMEQRRDDAARLELAIEADALEELQGGGMVGPCARHLFEIVLAQRLDQADAHARLRERERQAEPDRPGAGDDHAVGGVIHASFARVPGSAPGRSSSSAQADDPVITSLHFQPHRFGLLDARMRGHDSR
jgi:hypothetical protein